MSSSKVKYDMIVTLPRKTIDHFTLYADGYLIKKFFIKHETQHSFIFDDNYVLFLFYTYPHHRRAYVVTVDKIGLLPKTRLPGVKSSVTILYKARGKKIDMLKNALYLLRNLPYKEFPVLFYQKLSMMIETNVKMPRFMINELLESFNLGVI